MSELTASRNLDTAGRPVIWLLTAMAVGILGCISYFAISNNPSYSNREAYGISKYQLIEKCKEALSEPRDIMLSIQGKSTKLGETIDRLKSAGQLKAQDTLGVYFSSNPKTVVDGVQEIEAGKLGLSTPVQIVTLSGSSKRHMGQANMQCSYDKSTDKVEAVLSTGQ